MRLLLSCALVLSAAVLDRVAVTVGNDVITEGEIIDEIRITAFLNGEQPDVSAASRRVAAERLIDQHLIRNEIRASRYPEPENSESDRLLNELKRERFAGDDARYRKALADCGVNEQDLKAHLLWQLTALRFTDFRFRQAQSPANPAVHEHLEKQAQQRAQDRAPQQDGHAAPAQTPRAQNAVPPSVDQQMDAWLKQARARTRIDFRKEAFE